jgi:hypothetical protein
LPEAGVEEIVVVTDLETRFGEEVGKIPLEILTDSVETRLRFATGGHFALVHLFGFHTSKGS